MNSDSEMPGGGLMHGQVMERIGMWTVILAGMVAVATFVLFDTSTGVGAVAGGLTAIANWFSMRFVSGHIQKSLGDGSGADKNKGSVAALMMVKMGGLFFVSYILVVELGIDAIGFVIGLSSLVLGVLIGSMGLAGAAEGSET